MSAFTNIRSGTVDGFEDGGITTNVTRGSQTKTTDQTSTHIGQDITIQVGHDHDGIRVDGRISSDLYIPFNIPCKKFLIDLSTYVKTSTIQEDIVKLNVGEVLGDLLTDIQEETISQFPGYKVNIQRTWFKRSCYLHNVGLVDSSDTITADGFSVSESITSNTLRSFSGDQLDGLNNTIDNLIHVRWYSIRSLIKLTSYLVLNTGIFTFSVFTNEDSINILVRGLVTFDGATRTNVGIQVEGTTEGQVERNVTLTNGSSKRTLESNGTLTDTGNSFIRDGSLTVLDNGGNINLFPFNRSLCGGKDFLDRTRNLGTNTITRDEGDKVITLETKSEKSTWAKSSYCWITDKCTYIAVLLSVKGLCNTGSGGSNSANRVGLDEMRS